MSADTLLDVTWPFSTPFYTGGATSTSGVGIRWHAALNGHCYLIDLDPQQQWMGTRLGLQSLQALRTQADQGAHPDEATLTRDDYWDRTFTSYHAGAGQRWTDRQQSVDFMYRSSKGVNPWTQDRLTLLSDTTQAISSSTVTELVANSPYTNIGYMDNGVAKSVYFNADDTVNGGFGGTITGLSGIPGTFNSMASDGSYLYIIGGGTVWRCTGSGTFATSYVTGLSVLDCIGVAHGRVLVGQTASGSKIKDLTTGAAVTVGSITDTLETVVGFAEGTSVIYAAARAPTTRQSKIYKITFDPTTTTLGSPTVAGTLPAGETIQTIYGYLGFLFVGTSKGFRMCRQGSDGTLTIGPVVTAPGTVRCFTAVGQYVYFGWSNYDSSSSGIGRIDITVFTTADLVPAYASDLMASAAGTVYGLTALDNANTSYSGPRPYFSVQGTGGGIYQQHASQLVSSGTLDTGLFAFGFPGPKDFTYADVRHEPLVGSVTVSLSSDEGTFATIDTSQTQGSAGYFMKAGHRAASRHEMRVTLARQTTSTGPALTMLVGYVYPAVQRGDVWTVPFLIPDQAILLDSQVGYYDFWTEYRFIKGLAAARTPSTFQIGSETMTVYVDDYHITELKVAQNNPGGWMGTIVTTLKNLERVIAQ